MSVSGELPESTGEAARVLLMGTGWRRYRFGGTADGQQQMQDNAAISGGL